MRLICSSLYGLLFFVLPGEMLLVLLSQRLPLPPWLGLTLLNVAAYLAIAAALRWGTTCYDDMTTATDGWAQRLRDFLEIRGLRWLSLCGCVAVTFGAVGLWLAGQLPFPFWFLFGAIVLGLTDSFNAPPATRSASVLPTPRFDINKAEPLAEPAGKRVDFVWDTPLGDAGFASGRLRQAFVFADDECAAARNTKPVELPSKEALPRAVREFFGPSVQQVAAWFRRWSEREGMDAVAEMVNVVSFARSIGPAPQQGEHGPLEWSAPVEILRDGARKPEDHVVLAACLLYWLGHDIAFVVSRTGEVENLVLGYGALDAGNPDRLNFNACPQVEFEGRKLLCVEVAPWMHRKSPSRTCLSESSSTEVIGLA